MSCARWRDLLTAESVDEMELARRQEFLAHLQECPSCRKVATEADPTLVFSLLPPERVEETEVEEIRRTVQAMRRVRALEASWSLRSRRGLAAGAFAALVLIAIVLIPQRPEPQSPRGIPFAGAVGVGSGQMNVPQAPTDTASVVLQVELARSPRLAELSGSPTLHRVTRVEILAQPGELVDRDLGHGYRVQFRLAGELPPSGAMLKGFQLLQSEESGEVSLFNADLQPLPNFPLVLGLTPTDETDDQLWLLLTYFVDGSKPL